MTADAASGAADVELQNYDRYISTRRCTTRGVQRYRDGEVNAPDTIEYHKGMRLKYNHYDGRIEGVGVVGGIGGYTSYKRQNIVATLRNLPRQYISNK